MEFNEYIRPVPLACSSTIGMPMVTIGNGISNSGSAPPILQFGYLQITEQQDKVIYAKGIRTEATKPGDSGRLRLKLF